jgi:valyl-tRNA synthetase
MYEKTYLNWMENIHDWCISRQLWWGHRIPAWHCAACHKITVPSPAKRTPPPAPIASPKLTQETDVLDTWFSSGLLPVSVFGWPFCGLFPLNILRPSVDFQTFYPTSLLVTGFDILFFWVARMIMLGCWFAKDVPCRRQPAPLAESVPFKDVYIHALVRDANREKMSKTKGNVIDPIEIVKQYGTDAVRFTLASHGLAGHRHRLQRSQNRRLPRLRQQNLECRPLPLHERRPRRRDRHHRRSLEALGGMPTASEDAPLEARWIVAEFHKTAAEVNTSLANYRYDDAANTIYQFFWGSFCDWYLEIVKLRLDFSETADKTATKAALTTLLSVFEASLRLLSPFMPFLTEEIWHAVYQLPDKLPASEHAKRWQRGTNALVQDLIVEVRALRKVNSATKAF